jgi:hypothetical protein
MNNNKENTNTDIDRKMIEATSITNEATSITSYIEKDNTLRIKTLAGITSIMVNNNMITGLKIKEMLCYNTCLLSDDLLLIKDGKEIHNDDIVHLHTKTTASSQISNNDDNNNDNNHDYNDIDKTHDKKKKIETFIFALIRSTSTSKAELVIKNKNENKSYNLLFQANMKIFQLRKEISKLSGIRSTALRMILGSRVLKDEGILGDYILSAVTKKNKVSVDKQLVIQVSRIIDITQDVDIKVHFPNRSLLEFSMEVGVPMSTARQILSKRFFLPLDLPLEIFLDKQYRNKVDYSRSLIDYGIYPTPGKPTCVDLYIKVYDGMNNKKAPLNLLDALINDISSTFKTTKKTSKSKQRQLSTDATSSATPSVATIASSTIPSKKSRGGLFSSMKRGFLSNNKKDTIKKEDDCIINKEDDTPMKIKKMSNVTKQVLMMSENTLNFDDRAEINDNKSAL